MLPCRYCGKIRTVFSSKMENVKDKRNKNANIKYRERESMEDCILFLQKQKIAQALIDGVQRFRERYAVQGQKQEIIEPVIPFYGKEILEMCIAGLLEGENLLLTGPKATGKNVLAENLAWIFGRPSYTVSFHVGTGSAELIGTDTFRNGQVELRKAFWPQAARDRARTAARAKEVSFLNMVSILLLFQKIQSRDNRAVPLDAARKKRFPHLQKNFLSKE